MNIRIARNLKFPVNNTTYIVALMQSILKRESKRGQRKEHFWVIGLTPDHQILYIELVALGTVSSAIVNPSEVLEQAAAKGASKLILVHNHPSGQLTPSKEDKAITDRLIQAAKLLQKQILDHIIISTNDYYSFFGNGLIEEMERSLTYVIPFELAKQNRKEKAMEMANAMLKDQLPINKIRKYTQLSKKEIERLIEKTMENESIIENG